MRSESSGKPGGFFAVARPSASSGVSCCGAERSYPWQIHKMLAFDRQPRCTQTPDEKLASSHLIGQESPQHGIELLGLLHRYGMVCIS
jgi:hypothetical protein